VFPPGPWVRSVRLLHPVLGPGSAGAQFVTMGHVMTAQAAATEGSEGARVATEVIRGLALANDRETAPAGVALLCSESHDEEKNDDNDDSGNTHLATSFSRGLPESLWARVSDGNNSISQSKCQVIQIEEPIKNGL
jgi:hypothetical protein